MKKTIFFLLIFSQILFGQNLKRDIRKITRGKKATVAVAVRSIDRPELHYGLNGGLHVPLQSVFKFHIAMAVLADVDRGRFYLSQKIPVKASELREGTWSPLKEKYPIGDAEIPLIELLTYTVAQSDNNGADILIRLIGGPEKVQAFINGKKITDFNIAGGEAYMAENWNNQFNNWSTANSVTETLIRFYNGDLLSPDSTEFLYDTLVSTTTGKNRLIAGLPTEAVLAHKTGSSATQNGMTAAVNDAGLVVLPDGRSYAISVFVTDSKESEAVNEKIIADISKAAYQYFTSQKQP